MILKVNDNGTMKALQVPGMPDWNAPSTESGYIKNRTHWRERGTKLIDQNDDMQITYVYMNVPMTLDMTAIGTAQVSINIQEMNTISSLDYYNDGEGYITHQGADNNGHLVDLIHVSSTEALLQISTSHPMIVLDLPSQLHMTITDNSDVVQFNGTVNASHKLFYVDCDETLLVEGSYSVVFDGQEYDFSVDSSYLFPYVVIDDSHAIMEPYNGSTGDELLLVYCPATTNSFSIHNAATYHTLDPRYLPSGGGLTYSISISNNVITLSDSGGGSSTVTLPVYNGGVST